PDMIRDPAALRQDDGKPHPGLGRDPERTPMQWDAKEPNAGFAPKRTTPWLPVSPDVQPGLGNDVMSQVDSETSMLSLFKALTKLRLSDNIIAGLGFQMLNRKPSKIN